MTKQLRATILQRDNNQCVFCHGTERLAIHHKDNSGDWYYYKPVNNNPNNLITLCIHCHNKLHQAELKRLGQGYYHA